MNKWLVSVFDNNTHAYDEFFRTKEEALVFADKIVSQHIRWSCTLKNMERKNA